ncbi:MAG TPA: hypothetical protein VLD60_02500 [Nitrospira sp.]|nr:hypothetical protein [Nitrospira sp.]
MKELRRLLICGVSLVALAGCAGTGEVIPLQIHPLNTGSGSVSKPAAPLRVAVGPIEDGRAYKTGLGVRTHLWGGVSYFDVPGGNPMEVVAQTLSDYLTARGWQVTKRGSSDSADVILTGKILDLSVHAKSRVGFTEISTKTRLVVQARNVADESMVRMTLNGSGSDDEFWFDTEDIEELVNDVLTDSFGKLVHDTTVDNRLLRLKTP